MATSSIRKNFTIKDTEKYNKLVREINETDVRRPKSPKKSSLSRGKELLKQYPFR